MLVLAVVAGVALWVAVTLRSPTRVWLRLTSEPRSQWCVATEPGGEPRARGWSGSKSCGQQTFPDSLVEQLDATAISSWPVVAAVLDRLAPLRATRRCYQDADIESESGGARWRLFTNPEDRPA